MHMYLFDANVNLCADLGHALLGAAGVIKGNNATVVDHPGDDIPRTSGNALDDFESQLLVCVR